MDPVKNKFLRPGLKLPKKVPLKLPGKQHEGSSKQIADDIEWFYIKDGNSVGPFKTSVMKALIDSGELSRSTFVWNERLPDWTVACDTILDPFFNKTKITTPPTMRGQVSRAGAFSATKQGTKTGSVREHQIAMLSLKGGGYISLTNRKLTGSISALEVMSDGSKVKSTKSIDILLNLLTSTEITSIGAPTSVVKAFSVCLLATIGLFYLNISPWCWIAMAVTLLVGFAMFSKRYIMRISVAGNNVEIPLMSGDKKSVEEFIASVRTAKSNYERIVGL